MEAVRGGRMTLDTLRDALQSLKDCMPKVTGVPVPPDEKFDGVRADLRHAEIKLDAAIRGVESAIEKFELKSRTIQFPGVKP
jgi:hypothetical protein